MKRLWTGIAVFLALTSPLGAAKKQHGHPQDDSARQGGPAPAGQAAEAPGHARRPVESGIYTRPRINLGLDHGEAEPSAAVPASPRPWHGNVAGRQKLRQPEKRRETLRRLGAPEHPQPITERSHLMDSDRAHSRIRLPDKDLEGRVIRGREFGRNELRAPEIRRHMALVLGAEMGSVILRLNRDENRQGRYYWHHQDGFDYCHYYDAWGFHWYGWYLGERYFWTRFHQGRWWWHDEDRGRWCYWQDGWWWWQDPFHVGDLYVFSDGDYIMEDPGEGAQVRSLEPPDAKSWRSPDGRRVVKVMGDSADAFVYDASIPPDFDPRYLASKVKSVKFSRPASGPAQIMLTLADGSVDLFDENGEPVNFDEPGLAPAR